MVFGASFSVAIFAPGLLVDISRSAAGPGGPAFTAERPGGLDLAAAALDHPLERQEGAGRDLELLFLDIFWASFWRSLLLLVAP